MSLETGGRAAATCFGNIRPKFIHLWSTRPLMASPSILNSPSMTPISHSKISK